MPRSSRCCRCAPTSESSDEATGKETQANKTDRAGLKTGVSTRGETDPGDKTGKTERR